MAQNPYRVNGLGILKGYASDATYLSSTGTTVHRGDIYFNTTSNTYRYYDGTLWQDLPQRRTRAIAKLFDNTLTATPTGNQTIDGVLTVAGDKVLLAIHSTLPAIYVASTGLWTLAPDLSNTDGTPKNGDAVWIQAGSTKALTEWIFNGTIWAQSGIGVGTVVNSTLNWNGSSWVENATILTSTATIYGQDDNVADAAQAASISMYGSAKTAGTGDGGNAIISGGSSFGGLTGNVVLNGTKIQLNAQHAADPVTGSTADVYYNTVSNYFKYYNGSIWKPIGAGDVVGPASSTDTAIALFDGTTGKLIKNSGVTIDSLNEMLTSQTLTTTTGGLFGNKISANFTSGSGGGSYSAYSSNIGSTTSSLNSNTLISFESIPNFGVGNANGATVFGHSFAANNTGTGNNTYAGFYSAAPTIGASETYYGLYIADVGVAAPGLRYPIYAEAGTSHIPNLDRTTFTDQSTGTSDAVTIVKNHASGGGISRGIKTTITDTLAGGVAVIGINSIAARSGAGSASLIGGYFQASNTSSAVGNDADGLRVQVPINSSGSLANYYGLRIDGIAPGTVTGENYAIKVTAGDSQFGGNIQLTTQKYIEFQDTTGGEYVRISAPATISASYALKLPTAQGGASTVLTNDGSGNLSWGAGGGGGGMTNVTPVSYPYTAADGQCILVDSSSARSIQLPAPSANARITIKDAFGSAAANNITILRAGSEKIEGLAASYLIQSDWSWVTLTSDGTDWLIVG